MIVRIDGTVPEVDPGAWVAPGVVLAGRVRIGAESSVWYGCVLRADLEAIVMGARSNLQDSCVLHPDPSLPLELGDGVSVGHRAVLHGCTIEDDVLVGMGAVVLNGARVGAGSIVAAGAVVTEGARISPGSLVAGVPGRVRRAISEKEQRGVQDNATLYVRLAALHRAAGPDPSP